MEKSQTSLPPARARQQGRSGRGWFQMPHPRETDGGEAASSGLLQTVWTDQVPQRDATCECNRPLCAGRLGQTGDKVRPPAWRESKTHLAAVLPHQWDSKPGGRGTGGTLAGPWAQLKAAGQAREYRRQQAEELGTPGVPRRHWRAGTGEEQVSPAGEGVQVGRALQVRKMRR